MVFTYKRLVSGKGRILQYLSAYPIYRQDLERKIDTTNSLTTKKIAKGVFIERHHLTNYMRELKAQEYIEEITTRVKGKTRKQMIYFLTDDGRKKATEIKKDLMGKEITILSSNHEVIKLKFNKVAKYLKKNKICREITDFEICELADYKGIFDINRISKIEQNFIDFTNDALKPKYFFGRVKELLQLKTWIDNDESYHTIIIYGIAGIGKTSFTSKLIEYYRGNKHLFWHTFNKWDTVRSVLSHLAEFLSKIDDDYLNLYIDFNKPLDLDGISELLRKKLKNLNALFIFDDFQKANEDLRNFFTIIIEISEKTENVKSIILTRYNIPFYDQQKVLVRDSIAELEIEGLDFESSSEILRKKNLPQTKYKKIFGITSGHPLLLEIIDSNRKTKRYIYEEIFSQFSEEERMILEILSIYRGPIPYEAFFINDRILPESINNLTQKLIVKETSNGLYYIHEFIKDYFYKWLNPYTRYKYHNFCGEFYMKQKNSNGHIEALYHFIKAQEYQKAIDLALKKAQNIIDQGLSEKFLTILEKLFEEQVSLQWVNILLLKAKLCFIIGYWNKSLGYYHRAIEVCTLLNEENIKAQAYCEIGHILEEKNLFDNALENFQKGLEISKKISDSKLFAEAKRGIGRCYWRKSDYKNAEKYLKDSLKSLKNIDDFKLIGSIHIDLGTIYLEQYRTTQAIEYYNHSLEILEKVNDKTESMRAFNNLGTTFFLDGKFEDAIKCYEQQLELAKAIGDVRALGYGLSNAGCCYAKLNQITKAENYINKAKEVFEKTNNENILFQILRTDALINQHNQNWDKAIDCFNKSITIIKKLNVPVYLGVTLFDFGLLYDNKGDLDNAKKYYQQAQSIYQKMGWAISNQLEAKLLEFKII